MTEDDDDLLEIYADRNKPEDNYFANSKKRNLGFCLFSYLDRVSYLYCYKVYSKS